MACMAVLRAPEHVSYKLTQCTGAHLEAALRSWCKVYFLLFRLQQTHFAGRFALEQTAAQATSPVRQQQGPSGCRSHGPLGTSDVRERHDCDAGLSLPPYERWPPLHAGSDRGNIEAGLRAPGPSARLHRGAAPQSTPAMASPAPAGSAASAGRAGGSPSSGALHQLPAGMPHQTSWALQGATPWQSAASMTSRRRPSWRGSRVFEYL